MGVANIELFEKVVERVADDSIFRNCTSIRRTEWSQSSMLNPEKILRGRGQSFASPNGFIEASLAPKLPQKLGKHGGNKGLGVLSWFTLNRRYAINGASPSKMPEDFSSQIAMIHLASQSWAWLFGHPVYSDFRTDRRCSVLSSFDSECCYQLHMEEHVSPKQLRVAPSCPNLLPTNYSNFVLYHIDLLKDLDFPLLQCRILYFRVWNSTQD